MLVVLLVLVFASVIIGADLLVRGGLSLAEKLHISELAVGLTVAAFGTSLPAATLFGIMASDNIIDNKKSSSELSRIYGPVLLFFFFIFLYYTAGIAPILGGRFADFFSGRELAWKLNYKSPTGELSLATLNLQQWDFFFALAFPIGLYAIHRLAIVKEAGEVEGRIVAQELLNEVRTQVRILSSVEGLRQMVSFPVSIVRDITERIKTNVKQETD